MRRNAHVLKLIAGAMAFAVNALIITEKKAEDLHA